MPEHKPSASAEGSQHYAAHTQPLAQRPPGFPEAWLPVEGMFTIRGRGGTPAFRVTERAGGALEVVRLQSPVLCPAVPTLAAQGDVAPAAHR